MSRRVSRLSRSCDRETTRRERAVRRRVSHALPTSGSPTRRKSGTSGTPRATPAASASNRRGGRADAKPPRRRRVASPGARAFLRTTRTARSGSRHFPREQTRGTTTRVVVRTTHIGAFPTARNTPFVCSVRRRGRRSAAPRNRKRRRRRPWQWRARRGASATPRTPPRRGTGVSSSRIARNTPLVETGTERARVRRATRGGGPNPSSAASRSRRLRRRLGRAPPSRATHPASPASPACRARGPWRR